MQQNKTLNVLIECVFVYAKLNLVMLDIQMLVDFVSPILGWAGFSNFGMK